MKANCCLLMGMQAALLTQPLYAVDAVPPATQPDVLEAADAYLRVEPTQRIFYNSKGVRIGQLYANGYLFDELGVLVGILKDQRMLYDAEDKLIGEMDANGFIYNRAGELMGELVSTPLPGKDQGAPSL